MSSASKEQQLKSNAEDDPTWGILGMEQATSTRRVRTLDVGSAVRSLIADTDPEILLRQNKCLDNLAEQDRRAVKRITRPMMGGKSFRCARAIIAGIETMHMIRNCQWQTLKPKPRPKPTRSTAWIVLRRGEFQAPSSRMARFAPFQFRLQVGAASHLAPAAVTRTRSPMSCLI